MRFIYPDTSIWNRLCEQNSDPGALTSALANRGSVALTRFDHRTYQDVGEVVTAYGLIQTSMQFDPHSRMFDL